MINDTSHLVELIYEAAFMPEVWPKVLAQLSAGAGARGGVIQVVQEGARRPDFRASDGVRAAFEGYWAAGDFAPTHDRARLWAEAGEGFLRDIDIYPDLAAIEADPARAMLVSRGLGWQMGVNVRLPVVDLACFTFENPLASGPHPDHACGFLDSFLPHLSRAALIAARTALEQRRAQVEMLDRLGLAAAVVTRTGRLLAANSGIEAMDEAITFGAHGQLLLRDRAAQARLTEALGAAAGSGPVLSLPLRATATRPPMVLHVLPVRRSANDLFQGGHSVIVITPLVATAMPLSAPVLTGLFDLTAGEARLAVALASGQTLAEAARAARITEKTARTYLERVFAKTGTNKQAQLVALLKSVPMAAPGAGPDPASGPSAAERG